MKVFSNIYVLELLAQRQQDIERFSKCNYKILK